MITEIIIAIKSVVGIIVSIIYLSIYLCIYLLNLFFVPRGELNENKILQTFLGHPCCFRY